MKRFIFSLTAVQPHRQRKLARLWSQGQCLQHSAASCVLIFLFGEWTVICFHWPIASVAECRITLMDQNLRDINFLFSPSSAVSFLVPFISLDCSRAYCACPAALEERGDALGLSALLRAGQGSPQVSPPPFSCTSCSQAHLPHPQFISGACFNNN